MSDMIINQAREIDFDVMKWSFNPIGSIKINEFESEARIGKLLFDTHVFEFSTSIQIGDWTFTSERICTELRGLLVSNNDLNGWMFCAFHGNAHYNFGPFAAESYEELYKYVFNRVMTHFWPILKPDLYRAAISNVKIASWNIDPISQ